MVLHCKAELTKGPHDTACVSFIQVGKTYAAPEENKKLLSISCEFQPDPSVWLFDGDGIGTFGVMVCYDFPVIIRPEMDKGGW